MTVQRSWQSASLAALEQRLWRWPREDKILLESVSLRGSPRSASACRLRALPSAAVTSRGIKMADDWNLERFVQAQDGVLEDVLAELAESRKRTHWMWFVFPQIRGLGRTPMSVKYSLSDLDEAKAYLQHPVLGPRLRRCTELVLSANPADTANTIFGWPDNMKFQCMTIFALAADDPALFERALARFYGEEKDYNTLRILGAAD
jgi:uncharacterized protein (DUF1810 family)